MRLEECDRIYSVALSTKDEAEFKALCSELLQWYQINVVTTGRGKSVFWRGRIVEKEQFTNLRQMLAPDKSQARAGRLNRKGIPCFYLAGDTHTALREINAVTGQLVQFAGFRIRPGVTMSLIVIGEYAHVSKRGHMLLGGEDRNGAVADLLAKSPNVGLLLSIDKFFAHVLQQEEGEDGSGYMRTQVLAELLHAEEPEADGISFPSVKDTYGFNLGVIGSRSENLFQNVACQVLSVSGQYMFCMNELANIRSAIGVAPTGDFVWLPPAEDDARYRNIYGFTPEEVEQQRQKGNLFTGGEAAS